MKDAEVPLSMKNVLLSANCKPCHVDIYAMYSNDFYPRFVQS